MDNNLPNNNSGQTNSQTNTDQAMQQPTNLYPPQPTQQYQQPAQMPQQPQSPTQQNYQAPQQMASQPQQPYQQPQPPQQYQQPAQMPQQSQNYYDQPTNLNPDIAPPANQTPQAQNPQQPQDMQQPFNPPLQTQQPPAQPQTFQQPVAPPAQNMQPPPPPQPPQQPNQPSAFDSKPEKPKGGAKKMIGALIVLLIILGLSGGGYYFFVNFGRAPQGSRAVTKVAPSKKTATTANEQPTINEPQTLSFSSSEIDGLALSPYTIYYPDSWTEDEKSDDASSTLTLARDDYTISIKQAPTGGNACVFEGKMPKGPAADYRETDYKEVETAFAKLRRTADGNGTYSFCQENVDDGTYFLPTSIGFITYQIPEASDAAVLSQMDEIISTIETNTGE